MEAGILRIIPEVTSWNYAFSRCWLLEVELTAITRLHPVSLDMDAVPAEATIHYKRQALYRVTKALGL